MTGYRRLAAIICLLGLATAGAAADKDQGFVPMFNGKDLTGWVRVNCAPDTFYVKDGEVITKGTPTGFMRTEKQYENFIADFEWMHVNKKDVGNSGFFVWADPLPGVGTCFTRGIEVQVLVNLEKQGYYTSQGDLFSIHGATCKPDRPHPQGWMRCLPSENRCKGGGEWNHYRVTANDGVLKLEVNGKEVSGLSVCRPRKGYLALESEGAECHFRNLKIKELPSINPAPDEVANVAREFVPLLTGVDLEGWKPEPGHKGHWQPRPAYNTLRYDGKSEAKDKSLWTEKEFGDFELLCDWRWTAKPTKRKQTVILASGEQAVDEQGKAKEIEVDDAGNSGIYLRGSTKCRVKAWCRPVGSGAVYGYLSDTSLPAEVRRGVTPRVKADKALGQWNRFHITLKGERLTVKLNDQVVVEDAHLPGLPSRGAIGLQDHGEPVEFANLFVRELK